MFPFENFAIAVESDTLKAPAWLVDASVREVFDSGAILSKHQPGSLIPPFEKFAIAVQSDTFKATGWFVDASIRAWFGVASARDVCESGAVG